MRSTLSIAVVVVFLILHSAATVAAESDAPLPAVLDSIEANLWRVDTNANLVSFRMRTIAQIERGDGEVEEVETIWQKVEIREDGERLTWRTDEEGNLLPDEEPEIQDAENEDAKGKKKSELKVSLGPLDPVKQENRANHHYTLLPEPEPGQVAFRTETIDTKKGGFNAEYIIETATWTPLRITGSPVPMPDKKVKEMEMQIEYAPFGDGYRVPAKISTRTVVKWLLLTFRMRMDQEFFDHQPRE